MTRPIPMLGDVPLDYVVHARQLTRQRIAAAEVVGLAGDVLQGLGRASHEVELQGLLVGAGALDALHTLQTHAKDGAALSFHADIVDGLEVAEMLIVEAEFRESAGRPDRFEYSLRLRETPPLPEPASVSGFGGLDGVDLGFDTDVLGDIAGMADELQAGLDAVNDALGALDALSALSDLSLDNPLQPLQDETSELGALGEGLGQAGSALASLLGGG